MNLSLKKNIVIILCGMALIISGVLLKTDTAAASSWTSFRGNEDNNAVVDYATPIEQEYTEPAWIMKFGESADGMAMWGYAPNTPIIVDGDIITTTGKTIIRIDGETGKELASGELVGSVNWGYTPQTYVVREDGEKIIFCPLGGGRIEAVNADSLKELWTFNVKSSLNVDNNQSLSPIVYSDGLVFTGFYRAYDKSDYYVAIDAYTGELVWSYESPGGFYWNGAVAVGDAIIVGTQDGVNNNDVTGVSGLGLADADIISFDKKTGKIISRVTLPDASDICSTIVHEKPEKDGDKGRIYWTSCGGFIFSASVDETTGEISNVRQQAISGKSPLTVNTPVIYKDRIYFGCKTKDSYGSFAAFDKNTLREIFKVDLKAYPKGSPLLTTAYEKTDGYLYAYFTSYEEPGGAQVVKFKADETDGSGVEVENLFDANGYEQYGADSIIADDRGQLYFKNDSNAIFAIKKGSKIELDKVKGLKLKPSDGKVNVSLTGVNGATGYRVLYRINGTGQFTKADFDSGKGKITVPNGSIVTVRARAEYVDAAKTSYGDYSDDASTYVAKSTIKKMKAAKKAFTVKYDKHKMADGYQIQYSLKKSMKAAKKVTAKKASKVSVKVKKLKAKKKYFVRVRSYVKVDGKTLYGTWSTIKKVKTK